MSKHGCKKHKVYIYYQHLWTLAVKRYIKCTNDTIEINGCRFAMIEHSLLIYYILSSKGQVRFVWHFKSRIKLLQNRISLHVKFNRLLLHYIGQFVNFMYTRTYIHTNTYRYTTTHTPIYKYVHFHPQVILIVSIIFHQLGLLYLINLSNIFT